MTSWVRFAGCVLVVAVLSWAEALLVPIALAVIITFILAPPVTWLERWIGRVAATLAIVALLFTVLGLAGWGLALQLDSLANDLPKYRGNIQEKVADLRGVGKGGSVEKLQDTISDIMVDLDQAETPGRAPARPVMVAPPPTAEAFAWITSILDPLGTAGLVIAMVIFMLIDRRDLRNRVIRMVGRGHEVETIDALDEVGTRVSRQLLMQSLTSVIYGAVVGVGLYLLDVPYPWVWAVLGAVLRFVPYIGPLIAAGVPILVSLASADSWTGTVSVVGFFIVLELFTNMVLETVLYAGAAGISPVALLLSVAFWTWLWGPLGLLIAMPLTVCLVVAGKHVPELKFLDTLLSEKPAT